MKKGDEISKEKFSKIAILKKKLRSSSDDAEKKLQKDKQLKKKHKDSGGKSSSFARKFGKYMSSSSDSIRRASSSKSIIITSADVSDDQLSPSDYSTSVVSVVPRRHSVDQKEISNISVEVTSHPLPFVDSGEGITNSHSHPEKPQRQPVSVTPYAISAWRSNSSSISTICDNKDHMNVVSNNHLKADVEFMDSLLDENTDDLEDNQNHQNQDQDQDPDSTNTESTATINQQTTQKSKQIDSGAIAMPAFGNLVMDDVDVAKDRPDITSNISQSGLERKEHLYKILVIGELGTGKTSIIKRYVHQFFSQHYRATIGVDFALKVLNWDANTIIRLQLWDIAGQERFGNMTRVYYKDAVGAFIVFDVTRVATFDAVDKWKQDLDSKVQLPDGSNIPCVLLGNKCDQQKEGIVNTPSRMDEYCKEKGFSGWFETSAKENVNIEEAARFLVNKILLNDKLLHSSELNKDNDRIAIDEKGDTNGHSKSISKTCSC